VRDRDSRESGGDERSGRSREPRDRPPLVAVVLAPRLTLRRICAEEPRRHVLALVLATTACGLFARNAAAERNPLAAVALVGLASPLVALGVLGLQGALVLSVGRLLRGIGRPVDCAAALAWSWSPRLLHLPLTLAVALLPRSTLVELNAAVLALAIEAGVVVLSVGTVAGAHELGLGRAAAVVVVSVFAPVALLLAAAVVLA